MANSTGTETKRFFRYPERGPLGGVCAGVAEYANVDPNLVRLGALVLALMGPGIPAYLLAWIFLPASDGSVVAPHLGSGRGKGNRFSQVVGIVLIIIAVSVLWGDWWWPGRGWVLPFGLIAFGAWLLFKDDDEDDGDVPVPPPVPSPGSGSSPWPSPAPSSTSVAPALAHPPAGATEAPPTETPDTPATEGGPGTDTEATGVLEVEGDPTLVAPPPDGGDGPPTDHGTPSEPPPAPKARRRRVLGPLVFGALLVWGGIAWVTGVDVEDGLAIGLCILGAGFVLGAFVGGSKVLVLPALLVAAALVLVSVIDIPLHGGIGDRRWEVTSLSELDDTYDLAVGEAILDLSELDVRSGRVPAIEVNVGMGHLEVILPEGAAADVTARAGAGDIHVLGHSNEGMGVKVERTIRGDADGDRFELDLHVGLGKVEVHRAAGG